MSHTFYNSPTFSIDVTRDYVWFFEYPDENDVDGGGYARVPRSELPAIRDAIIVYLEDEC